VGDAVHQADLVPALAAHAEHRHAVGVGRVVDRLLAVRDRGELALTRRLRLEQARASGEACEAEGGACVEEISSFHYRTLEASGKYGFWFGRRKGKPQ